MTTVDYTHDFQYRPVSATFLPILQFQLQHIANGRAVEVDTVVDTGTMTSLFDGGLGRSIGLNLLDGTPRRWQSTSGLSLQGYLHRVRLVHEDLGTFEMDIGFSIDAISRNLLGRDFLHRIQIGFREHHTAFFVTPSP